MFVGHMHYRENSGNVRGTLIFVFFARNLRAAKKKKKKLTRGTMGICGIKD